MYYFSELKDLAYNATINFYLYGIYVLTSRYYIASYCTSKVVLLQIISLLFWLFFLPCSSMLPTNLTIAKKSFSGFMPFLKYRNNKCQLLLSHSNDCPI